MSHRSEAQDAAIHRFETDYFPTLEQGIVSKDITRAMRQDWAILLKDDVPLAVAKTEPAPAVAEVTFARNLDELEAAIDFVGIREEAPVTPKVGKGRHK